MTLSILTFPSTSSHILLPHLVGAASGVTRSTVIPRPETEVIGESGSGGLGAADAEKGLILHVLRIS